MADDQQPEFVIAPSPDHPGWLTFDLEDVGRFNGTVIGPVIMREEPDGRCRARCVPRPHLLNARDNLHGGALLGLIDISLFAGLALLTDGDVCNAVTLDLSTQFIGAGRIDQPLDAVTEILRETRRLAFLRGVLEQDGTLIAAFNATVRKAGPRG